MSVGWVVDMSHSFFHLIADDVSEVALVSEHVPSNAGICCCKLESLFLHGLTSTRMVLPVA